MHERLSFYIHRSSFLHSTNPMTKLVFVFALIINSYFSPFYWTPTILVLGVLFPLSFIGKVNREFFGTVAKLLIPVAGLLFIMQSLFLPYGEKVVFQFYFLDATAESIRIGYQTATRIFLMAASFILFLLTTHPSEMMSDLTRRGLPGQLAYVVVATLQILPQMQAKATAIIAAQRSRGLDTEGSLVKRIGALVPLVSPLVFGSLDDRSQGSAFYLSRRYGGAEKYQPEHFGRRAGGHRRAKWLRENHPSAALQWLAQTHAGQRHGGDWNTHTHSVSRLAARVGYVFQNPYDLSPTWRKMVALASVFAMDTPILILDEPTTGQDDAGLARIAEVVQAASGRGKTVIAITHDMDFCAENFARVIALFQGEILIDGDIQTVLGDEELLAKTYVEPPQLSRLGKRLAFPEIVCNQEEFLSCLKERSI